MNSTRQQKIARLIQKELGDMFQKQTSLTHGLLVSVSEVRVSSDLQIASVYLSVFPPERGKGIVDNVNGNVKELRRDFGQRVRHQLRVIPELRFFLDDSLEYLEHIDELLKK
mgnify:CR=1 FL=1